MSDWEIHRVKYKSYKLVSKRSELQQKDMINPTKNIKKELEKTEKKIMQVTQKLDKFEIIERKIK